MIESSIPADFASRLRHIREQRGVSQSELAREAGMQPSAIAHFEAGRRKPSFDNVRSLAKALIKNSVGITFRNLSVDVLFDRLWR